MGVIQIKKKKHCKHVVEADNIRKVALKLIEQFLASYKNNKSIHLVLLFSLFS